MEKRAFDTSERPLIGVTAQVDSEGRRWIRSSYAEAICHAGGVPVFIDHLADEALLFALCMRLDGVLFTGGVDIHPKYYGEAVEEGCGEITERRDVFEFSLYRIAKAQGLPILGICRGMQLLNVAEGGTLRQNIEGHSDTEHAVTVEGGSLLCALLGGEATVGSYHHQAVKTVGRGCRVTAVANDGVIEGIERDCGAFWLGVQWHPELLCRENDGIFPSFVGACAVYGGAHGHF